MSDLNLNFDTGVKSVTMGNPSNDNIAVKHGENSPRLSSPQPPQANPSLSVADPVGIEFLAKGSNSTPQIKENTPK